MIKRRSKELRMVRENPMFQHRVEETKKGKQSYNRKKFKLREEYE